MLAVHPLFTYQIKRLPIISVKTNNYSSWTFGELNACKDSEAFLLKWSLLCQNSTFAWGIFSVGRRWNEVIIGSYCQQMLTSDRNQIKHFMKINEDFSQDTRLDPTELNAVRAERWHHVPHGEASSILSAKPQFSQFHMNFPIFKQHF